MPEHKFNAELVCSFNTGAHYTDKGQRIAVFEISRLDPDRVVRAFLMADFDRGLRYMIEWRDFGPRSPARWTVIASYIKTCYDYNLGIVYDDYREGFSNFCRELLRQDYSSVDFKPHAPHEFRGLTAPKAGSLIEIHNPAPDQALDDLLAKARQVCDTFKLDFECVAELQAALDCFDSTRVK